MLIHRRNLLEAARPELVLTDWSREDVTHGEVHYEVVKFRKIRNIGRGIALGVYMNCSLNAGRYPIAVMSTIRVPVLAAGEELEVDGSITIWWKNAEPHEGVKWIAPAISMLSWDARNMRHETTYRLFISSNVAGGLSPSTLAPGIDLSSRSTVSRPVWALKSARFCLKAWNSLKLLWERQLKRTSAANNSATPQSTPVANEPTLGD